MPQENDDRRSPAMYSFDVADTVTGALSRSAVALSALSLHGSSRLIDDNKRFLRALYDQKSLDGLLEIQADHFGAWLEMTVAQWLKLAAVFGLPIPPALKSPPPPGVDTTTPRP